MNMLKNSVHGEVGFTRAPGKTSREARRVEPAQNSAYPPEN